MRGTAAEVTAGRKIPDTGCATVHFFSSEKDCCTWNVIPPSPSSSSSSSKSEMWCIASSDRGVKPFVTTPGLGSRIVPKFGRASCCQWKRVWDPVVTKEKSLREPLPTFVLSHKNSKPFQIASADTDTQAHLDGNAKTKPHNSHCVRKTSRKWYWWASWHVAYTKHYCFLLLHISLHTNQQWFSWQMNVKSFSDEKEDHPLTFNRFNNLQFLWQEDTEVTRAGRQIREFWVCTQGKTAFCWCTAAASSFFLLSHL